MATSGSTNWSIGRNDIIAAALRKCSSYDAGNTISSEDLDACSLALNAMVKEWMSVKGLRLALRREHTLILIPGQQTYDLGTTGDHFFLSSDLVETTIRTDEAIGQTSLEVTSSTGMLASDYLLVVQDDGTVLETTISSVTDSDTIVAASALTDEATAGNKVYTYTTKAARPQKVLQAWRRDRNSLDQEVEIVGRYDYNRLPNKTSAGVVTQIAWSPVIGNSVLYVWPVKDEGDTTDKLILMCERIVEDFDAAADTPDFPVEWTNALIWNLAAEVAFEYKVPALERREIERVGAAKLASLLDSDVEEASVHLGARVYG